MINLRLNQRECYDIGLNLDKFLISAKCRFGKTYVATKLIAEGWNSHTTIIMSGKDVRGEWDNALREEFSNHDLIIYTNEELNTIDFNSIPNQQRVVIFLSLQKAGRSISDLTEINYNEDEDSEELDYTVLSNIALINFVNKRTGLKTLVLDEAHFAEQTERTQNILNSYKDIDKILYLTATPYTHSLKEKFPNTDMIYTYSYKDEMEEVANGTFKGHYTPVKMNWFIPDLTSCIGSSEEEGSKEWNQAFNNINIDVLISKLISCVKKRDKRNFVIFVDRCDHAYLLKERLKTISNVNAEVIVGNQVLNHVEGTSLSERAERWYHNHNTKNVNDFNFLISCGRLGTGSSVPSIEGVVFLRKVNQLITLEQYSARAITPSSDFYRNNGIKTECDIYLFNRYNELKVLNDYIIQSSKDKCDNTDSENDLTDHTRDLFNSFVKHCPIYIEQDLNMVELTYEKFLSSNYISYKDDELFNDIIDSDIVNNLPLTQEGKKILNSLLSQNGCSTIKELIEKAKSSSEARSALRKISDLRKALSTIFKQTLNQLDDLSLLNININKGIIEFNTNYLDPFNNFNSIYYNGLGDDSEEVYQYNEESNFEQIITSNKLTMEFMNYIKENYPVIFYKFYYTKHLNLQI